jgi:hypothetical protein
MDQLEKPGGSYKWYYNVLSFLRIILGTCWLSLFIILLIVLLLLLLEQGGTIIIDLLSDPLSLASTVFLVNAMALAIGHYPVYILKWKRENNLYNPIDNPKAKAKWKMHNSFLGIGFITYEDPKSNNYFNKKAFDYVRGFLSIALLLAFVYVLSFVYGKYVNPDFNVPLFLGIIALLSLCLYSFLFFEGDRLFRNHSNFVLALTAICFWISIFLLLYSIWMATLADGSWNVKVYSGVLLLYIFTIIDYILFKKYRGKLNLRSWLFPLSVLKAHKNYITMLGITGFLSLGLIILSHFNTFLFNPLVIILAALYLLYGVIIVVLKHRFYYKYMLQEENPHRKLMRYVFLYIAPLVPLVLLVWAYFAGSDGNNLHALPPVDKKEVMMMEEFKDHLYTSFAQQTEEEKKIYFIASYGGGLKANAWNMMVLDSLSNFKGQNILKNTIALSGVSGGALGQAFYTGLAKNYNEKDSVRSKIDLISNANFLSIDLAWLLGWDLVREFWFWDPQIKNDRAKKVMELYAEKIGDRDMNTTDFQSYWKEVFDEKGHFPLLIANTSGTHQKRGVACAVSTDSFQLIFPHADNILELNDDKSLAYLHAVSCAHRFPIFSPAAKIEGKGHYLDGGYFENSGMLSLLNLYDYLKRDSRWKKTFGEYKVVFIQIRNSKTAYLREQLQDQLSNNIRLKEVKETGELGAIIKTITSISFIPRYIESEMQQDETDKFEYLTIDLPYKFDKEDVLSYYKAESFDCTIDPLIDSVIDFSKRSLDSVLYQDGHNAWTLAEPPLARLLSQPAVNYMRQVLHRDTAIFYELEKVLKPDTTSSK